MTGILDKSWGNARITNWRVDDDGMLRVTAHILKEIEVDKLRRAA